MYKNASYKEKFIDLLDWLPTIIDAIKKDLKSEHLKKDLGFVKRFLSSKNFQKISLDEMVDGYRKALLDEETGEKIGELLTARWLLKHTEMYDFFEQFLNAVTSDFTHLEELSVEQSQQLMQQAIQAFGAIQTYLFAILNSVVFPAEIFQQLKMKAQDEKQQMKQHKETAQAQLSLENMQQHYETEKERLIDKYEKKLSGLQKKYLIDVEGLKKQLAILQRKMQEKARL